MKSFEVMPIAIINSIIKDAKTSINRHRRKGTNDDERIKICQTIN